MRKFKVIAISLLVVLLLAGCAGLKVGERELTTDEQARLVVDGLNRHLNRLLDDGEFYLRVNPDFKPVWEGKILPISDRVTKEIKRATKLFKEGELTPEGIQEMIDPILDEFIIELYKAGAKK